VLYGGITAALARLIDPLEARRRGGDDKTLRRRRVAQDSHRREASLPVLAIERAEDISNRVTGATSQVRQERNGSLMSSWSG